MRVFAYKYFILTRVKSPLTQILLHRKKCSSKLKDSYLIGPGKTPLKGMTIGQVFSNAADQFGDREALISCHQGIRKTFIQTNKDGEDFAAGLIALGFKPGDRIGIWSPNRYEWYVTEIAAAKAGLVLVNINPGYRPNELEFCLNKVSVKGIICAEKFKTSEYYKLMLQVAPELESCKPGQLKSKNVPSLQTVIMMSEKAPCGTLAFKEVFEAGGSESLKKIEELSKTIQFDDPSNIQFTSGTTGQPKAALLSHHNMVNNSYMSGLRSCYHTFEARICLSVPLYHCFGGVLGVLGACQHGATIVMPSEAFDPKAIVKTLAQERITNCYGTPTMFVDILNEFKKKPCDFTHLRGGIMGGSSCPQELLKEVSEVLNMTEMSIVYGLTETTTVVFQSFITDPAELKFSTVGFPLDHTEVKLVDEDNRIVPIGSTGELCVRAFSNFLGYWGNEDKTKEIFSADRWLRTGDLARLNSEGYVQIIGRSKDMIIRGGENIYPAEVENFFMGHPEIIEAQVFGVPDQRMGEEVAMWIRKIESSSLTEEDIKKWAKEKIAHFKIPRYVLFKEEFPRTITGKIQKFVMKEKTVSELQL